MPVTKTTSRSPASRAPATAARMAAVVRVRLAVSARAAAISSTPWRANSSRAASTMPGTGR
jgi:hypothetical protein